MEAAFVAYSAGRAELPAVIHLDVPESRGEIHVKAGHLHGAPTYAVKVASGFYAEDPPAIDGMVVVFDARTGAPRALLLDGGMLTDVRTGAAGGVAARHLAPERVGVAAMIGTGIQARRQVEALRCVREVGAIRVWGRDPAKRGGAPRPTSAPRRSGTCARGGRRRRRDHHVHRGAGAAREAEWVRGRARTSRRSGLTGSASRSSIPSCSDAPTCWWWIRATSVCGSANSSTRRSVVDRAVELGTIASGEARGRTSSDQLTICDLTGVGVQDVAAANAVLANAASDAGSTIEV